MINKINKKGVLRISFYLIIILAAIIAIWGAVNVFGTASNINVAASPRPTNVSSNITFNVSWTPTNENQTILVCRDSACSNCWANNSQSVTSGCLCNNSNPTAANAITPFYCNYTAQEDDDSSNPFWIKVCNKTEIDSNICNSTATGSIPSAGDTTFLVNHRPYASNVAIYPASPTTADTLTCNYAAFNDADGDSENTTAAVFWWWNTTSQKSPTTKTLGPGNFVAGELIKCGVKVTDEHGFPDDVYRNSSSSVTMPPPSPMVI